MKSSTFCLGLRYLQIKRNSLSGNLNNLTIANDFTVSVTMMVMIVSIQLFEFHFVIVVTVFFFFFFFFFTENKTVNVEFDAKIQQV